VTRTKKIVAGFVFKNEEFKPEYEDLSNWETKKFIQKVEKACTEELAGIGLTRCKVTRLRKGSVIVDLELTFNQGVSQYDVDDLLMEATRDGKFGELEVSAIQVGSLIEATLGPTEGNEECNPFSEGQECKKAKPALQLIALCAVAGAVVLALLTVIIVCSMHKKKISGGTYSHRHVPEGKDTVADLNAANGERVKYENLYGKVNTGYQNDGQPATAMVTFNPNPAHKPDIALNFSSMTK